MTPRRATIALVAVTFVWGSTFVIVKDAIEQLPVLPFNTWRFAIATVAVVAIAGGRLRELGRRGATRGFVLGVALWAGYAFQTFGLERTTPAKAAFVTGMVVVITPLLQAPVLGRAPSRAAAVGAVLATVGLALLVLQGSLVPALGDLLVLACAVAYAFHLLGLGAWSRDHPAGPLAAVQLGTVAVLSAAGGLVQGAAGPPLEWMPRGASVWMALAVTGLLASAFGFVAQTSAQRVLPPARTAVIFTMEPVFAWLVAWTVGAGSFGVREGVGAALILAGMLWSELRTAEPADALAAPETATIQVERPVG